MNYTSAYINSRLTAIMKVNLIKEIQFLSIYNVTKPTLNYMITLQAKGSEGKIL